ncbi:MAG: hypothetical protein ACE5GB_14160 [Acidimicrobiales bacterium]
MSAVDGRRVALEGLEVERPARPVVVHRFDVEPIADEPGVWRAVVECSSGTYVRVLAADLGVMLGGGGHLRALRRTAVGGFTLADAGPLEHIELLAPAAAVSHLPSVGVDSEVARLVGHGRPLGLDVLGVDGAGPWAVMSPDRRLLAVYERHLEGAKPVLVLPA